MISLMTKCGAALLLSGACFAALADIVVVVNPANGGLSKDQISNIYLGRSFEFKPLDMPEGNGTRDQFYKKLTDRDPPQIKAVWARVVFTGKGQAPLMLPDADLIKKAVATDPKAVGYIDKSAVDSSVKVVLTLD